MSWIKKLLKKIKQEEEEFDSYDEQISESSIFDFNRLEQKDAARDIEARITYHYPKGSFRFPLIPDEPKERSEKRVQRSKELQQEPKNALLYLRIEEEEKERERELELNKNRLLKSRHSIEKELLSKRPFRPTEIPSPIFGYERPKQSTPIEHELNSTTYEENEHDFLSAQMNQETSPSLFQDETEEIKELEIVLETEKESGENELEEIKIIREVNSPTIELKEHEPSSTRKRTHLPFNVIMLSQDRKRMDRNRTLSSSSVTNTKKSGVISSANKSTKEQIIPDRAVIVKEESLSPIPIHKVKDEQKNQLISKPKEDLTIPSQSIKKEETLLSEISRQFEENNEALPHYVFPSINLLIPPVPTEENGEWLKAQEQLLNDTLMNFNVKAKVVNVTQGPSVTRFEVQPDPGVKVNKITNLADDIKLSLAARDIRIEAPIPGKHTIGIEVPNHSSRPVLLSEIITSDEFLKSESPLTVALGLDISGKPIVTDLRKMPHGLIAGSTGSGKSVCINTMLVSLLFKANPDELKLLLIDPKMVELAPYNYIPHLVSPVITDVKAATAALKWSVEEMERRYELFAHTGVRDITRFNSLAEEQKHYSDKLPYIVIIIDELADLMMMSPTDVEEAICRIAQKARACGIHLIIATQRPSVDVITGLIKANVPTRIAFSVSSQIDSRTIIDISGAEKLLGKGDMLFLENGSNKPVRLQGTFVSDAEIDGTVAHVRKERRPVYLFEQEELLKKAQITEEEDELFYEACEFIISHGGASTSSLQRRFKIGYNRAARLIDLMEQQGFISEARGSKPRDVLITEAELDALQDTSTI